MKGLPEAEFSCIRESRSLARISRALRTTEGLTACVVVLLPAIGPCYS